MTGADEVAYLGHMNRIKARESLESITLLRLALTDSSEVTDQMIDLAMTAFPDDDIQRARVIEALSRK